MIQHNMLDDFVEVLKLKKPVDLQFRFCQSSDYDAEYWPKMRGNGKIKRHIIRFYVCADQSFERPFNTLLAHELIHAWQAENDVTDIHGQLFQEWACKLEKDFNLDRIYDCELDCD